MENREAPVGGGDAVCSGLGWSFVLRSISFRFLRVVQVACTLCQRVQDSLLLSDSGSGRVHSKLDRSPVTVTDWGVQAIVSWLLSDCFHDGSVSIVAEEDDKTLSSSDGAALLESVVAAVNGCLVEAPKYGLKSLEKELCDVCSQRMWASLDAAKMEATSACVQHGEICCNSTWRCRDLHEIR